MWEGFFVVTILVAISIYLDRKKHDSIFEPVLYYSGALLILAATIVLQYTTDWSSDSIELIFYGVMFLYVSVYWVIKK